MNQELQNKLFEKYPELFANKDNTPMQSPMCFGIECGDGWYDLISATCWRIKNHAGNIEDRKKYNPEYTSNYTPVVFDQVKEKYGGLRIYFSGGDEYVEGIVDMAAEMSYDICEVCGNKGKPNKSGWITTLCERCRNER